jgi:DNA polymerase III delta prime subunit
MRAIASTEQSKIVHRAHRIIERPRLIKLLDESEATTILLLAPPGYGKTTLARQWAKTLNGVVWVTATSAHRDVATFAEDVAAGIDRIGGDALQFITEYVRAKSNPQRAAHDIATRLATRINLARTQWIVIDDYQELTESAEVEELIAVLEERTACRFLVASRLRPRWANPRRVIYGDVRELGREELGMTATECDIILHRKPHHARVAADAQGWPAVLGLVAALALPSPPEGTMPQALYQYLAEELFQSATEQMRDHLLALALAPDLSFESLQPLFGPESGSVLEQAHDLGFLLGDGPSELHPLLREFLLSKLTEEPGAESRVRDAVVANVTRRQWDRALELVLRFNLLDLVDPILDASFKPLVRSGRLGSLSAFAAKVTSAPIHPPAGIDVVEAEVALQDGQLDAAIEIATRACECCPQIIVFDLGSKRSSGMAVSFSHPSPTQRVPSKAHLPRRKTTATRQKRSTGWRSQRFSENAPVQRKRLKHSRQDGTRHQPTWSDMRQQNLLEGVSMKDLAIHFTSTSQNGCCRAFRIHELAPPSRMPPHPHWLNVPTMPRRSPGLSCSKTMSASSGWNSRSRTQAGLPRRCNSVSADLVTRSVQFKRSRIGLRVGEIRGTSSMRECSGPDFSCRSENPSGLPRWYALTPTSP